ncbi:ATP/GTP-binding protein [uncultured Streptomyces sp.]|uniref:ATP/GTP-binding protein n=1 Tax=uncultured Streptomyces sp. TaxID=174707 RepID=UPI00262DFE68|nr:ATP/GTP-binding protein [uncultured Streptomyces sp.]
MSTDDTDAQLIAFPTSADVLSQPPELPDPARLFPPVREEAVIPPESPEGTTMELPAIPRPMDPEMALLSDGIPAPEVGDEFTGGGESEYVQRRSLAERLGDWLEYRIALGHARLESEAPFREAEIARKVGLLNARTAREVGLLEQQNKLRAAQLKARADKAGARGKGDAGGSKAGGGRGGSGLGADKGGRKNPSPGPAGPRQQPKPQQHNRQQSPAPKQPAPAPKPRPTSPAPRPRGPAPNKQQPKPQGPGPKQPVQNPKQPAPRQSRTDDKARPKNGPLDRKGPSGRKDGPGGRKVDLSKGDRTKKTPGGPSGGGGGGGKSPAPGPKGKADGKIRYDEPKKFPPGVRHGSAKAYDEHQCRCRRCVDAAHRGGKRAQEKGADTPGPGTGKAPGNGPQPPSDAPKAGPGPTGPGGSAKGAEQPSGGPKNGSGPGPGGASSGGPGWAGNRKETPQWPPGYDRPSRRPGQVREDIVDADIVPDAPAAVTTGVKGLPPAPEPHTDRPGTTRPTAQEDLLASEVSRLASQAGMAAQHRTDVTFGEYLTEIVNIWIAAGADRDRAQELAAAIGKVADALRDMAADLVGDHNIDARVVNQITDLADAASRMKQLAERCASECEIASEAALLTATAVGWTYSADMQAMDDAGLAHASAATHHD